MGSVAIERWRASVTLSFSLSLGTDDGDGDGDDGLGLGLGLGLDDAHDAHDREHADLVADSLVGGPEPDRGPPEGNS